MTVYLYCYVTGDGYTLKRASAADTSSLTEIKRQDISEGERELFLENGVNLFWGRVDGRPYGCVRNLETDYRDENGRKCFVNAAFSDESGEGGQVDAIMDFALNHRQCFLEALEAAIVYENGDYRLDDELFAALVKAARSTAGPFSAGAPVLVLEDAGEGSSTLPGTEGSGYGEAKRLSTEEWRRRELPMRLFFYASTPGSGFVLQRIDPATGKKICGGEKAHEDLLPSARKILNNAGASIAVFEEKGRMCLVAKDLRSESTDKFGRRKLASFVMDMPASQPLAVLQTGAWALLDNSAFANMVTGCVRTSAGGTSFEVLPEPLAHLLARFTNPLELPEGTKYADVWKSIVKSAGGHSYRLLALDVSIDYFRRVSEIDLEEKDIGCLVTAAQRREYRETPMALTYSLSMVRFPPVPAPKVPDGAEKAKEEENGHADGPAPRPVPKPKPDLEPGPEPKPEPDPEPLSEAEPDPKPGPKPEPQPVSEFKDRDGSEDEEDDGDIGSVTEEESIDLLDYKWFIPAVIGIVVAIIVIIVLLIRFL